MEKAKKKHRWRKILITFGIVILLFIGLVIALISPITKYLVEKYDKKYLGREIKMDWAYVNPFTGYIYFSNVKIYEMNSDSLFLSAKGLGATISVRKLFSKNYEITSLTLDEPRAQIVQNKNYYNLKDIIDRFSGGKKDSTAEPVHFDLLNMKINEGMIRYVELLTPI